MDDEPFNPDYVEVDRVLDVSESTDENGEVRRLAHPSASPVHQVICLKTDLPWLKLLLRRVTAIKMSVRPPRESPEKCVNSVLLMHVPAACNFVPGEVVFLALRGQHVGAKSWHWPRQDRRVWEGDGAWAGAEACGKSCRLSSALFIFSFECWASEGRGPRSCGCTETTNGNCFIWNRSDLPLATGRNPRVPENIKTAMRSGNTSWRESTGCSSTGSTRMYAITKPSSCTPH